MRAFPWESLPRVDARELAAPWLAALACAERPHLAGPRWGGILDASAAVDAVGIDLRAGPASAVALVAAPMAIALADRALGRDPELAAPRPTTAVERALAAFAVVDALAAGGIDALATVRERPVDGAAALLCWAHPAPGWIGIAAAVGHVIRTPGPLRLGRVPDARAAIELARAPVAVRRLAGLARGDVVVVGAAQARLAVGRGSFAATLDRGAGRLTVVGPYQRAPMADPTSMLADDLQVALTVVIGTVTLSVRALGELGPGAVLTTAAPLGGPVELRAGDRVVARGELVEVDGAIGVRIHDVLSPPATAC